MPHSAMRASAFSAADGIDAALKVLDALEGGPSAQVGRSTESGRSPVDSAEAELAFLTLSRPPARAASTVRPRLAPAPASGPCRARFEIGNVGDVRPILVAVEDVDVEDVDVVVAHHRPPNLRLYRSTAPGEFGTAWPRRREEVTLKMAI